MAEIRVTRQPKTYTLTITLVDQDGEAVVGAEALIADNKDGPFSDLKTSDETGTVWWDRLPGLYYLRVSGVDFQTVEYVAELEPDRTLVWERERYYR